MKKSHLFFCYKYNTPTAFCSDTTSNNKLQKMEKFLNMLESSWLDQQIFEEKKIKFFASKILIWYFF